MVRRTMYQPLVEYLAIQSERDVSLSLVEIEAIIGRPLSVSALIDAAVWHATTEPHVRRWREIGWRARYDRRNQSVHFTRDAEE